MLIHVTRAEFLQWLEQQPDDKVFDLDGHTGAASCGCPMIEFARSIGTPAIATTSRIYLMDDRLIMCVGWGYLSFTLGKWRFTAKELKEHMRVRSS